MKYVLSLMILFSHSVILAQDSGTSGVRSTSYYYGDSGNGTGGTNNQDNDFTYNDNRTTDYNTTNHSTTNVIEAREGTGNAAWEACAPEHKNKSGKKMRDCLDNYNRGLNQYSDYPFEADIFVSCSKCAGNPKWYPNQCAKSCTDDGKPTDEAIAEHSDKDACEHSDKACNAVGKGEVQAKLDKDGGHYCPECEKAKARADLKIAKVNAKRDVALAKEATRATKHKYKERNTGFWNALGTIATAAAGVLAPVLVEKERTKQLTSCHNSFANSGADVVEQNRLAWQEQLYAEERNFLPLTSWEYQSQGANNSHLCNGFPSNQFAGPFGPGGGGIGIPGFSPYGPGGGQYGPGGGIPGFSPYGQQGGLGNPFGSLLGGLGGLVPNLNFGLNGNANFNAGATAWTGQTNGYYGTDPYSPYPNSGIGGNAAFNQGGGIGGYPSQGGGALPFQF